VKLEERTTIVYINWS